MKRTKQQNEAPVAPHLDPPASVNYRSRPGTVPAEDDHRYGRGHQEATAHYAEEMAMIAGAQEAAENFSGKPAAAEGKCGDTMYENGSRP
ncbi:MAG TPA: hypothetical protein VG870_06820 [Chitinophagaceae bacterium]|nr:hypothetical protein [Chitinophagaceae bacterium]